MNNSDQFIFLYESYLDKLEKYFDRVMDDLSKKKLFPGFLDSLNYYFRKKGKMLRSIILLRSAEIENIPEYIALPAAIGVEMFQTFTLIHDDLPALDNDDTRRGVPSLHKVFGEANAILTGDALAIYCFKLMTEGFFDTGNKEDDISGKQQFTKEMLFFINQFAQDTALFLIDGQQRDISFIQSSKYLSEEEYLDIYEKKTGIFFSHALCFGRILGNKSTTDLRNAGKAAGICFQLKDDMADYLSEKKERILSFAVNFGIQKTKEIYSRYYDRVEDVLKTYDPFIWELFQKYF